MSDLISRSALIEEIEKQKLSLDKNDLWSYNMTLLIVDVFYELINNQPAVEAKAVVHGSWTHTGYADEYECSNCRSQIALSDDTSSHPNFCPNCGCDMRGEKNG